MRATVGNYCYMSACWIYLYGITDLFYKLYWTAAKNFDGKCEQIDLILKDLTEIGQIFDDFWAILKMALLSKKS